MNPLVPSPDTIPVPWGYFQFLLMLTFALHLLLMNALVGSTGIALYSHLRGGEVHGRLASGLSKVLPILAAFTVNFGVAPLLFVQVLYGHLFYASSILMAVFWLAVIPLLIAAYYAAYLYGFRFGALGAAAIGGLFVALFGRVKERKDREVGELATRLGLRVFLAFTMAEVAAGFWFLASLPREVMLLFMGRSAVATVLFAAGIFLTAIVLLTAFKRRVLHTVAFTVVLVYLMTFLRDFVRTGYLAPVFSPAQLKVAPQFGPMILFAVTLVAGLSVIAWMILKAKEAVSVPREE
jgi:hypothetical protein